MINKNCIEKRLCHPNINKRIYTKKEIVNIYGFEGDELKIVFDKGSMNVVRNMRLNEYTSDTFITVI